MLHCAILYLEKRKRGTEMKTLKNFFNITENKYVFDYNDIRCLLTVCNISLIVMFGLSVIYVSLAIAIFGTIRDLVIEDRRINSTIIHLANIVLNIYLLTLI